MDGSCAKRQRSFDLTFTVNTDKVQLNTLEKVDGAVITVTPSRTGGSVDGGSWRMSPAAAQTITTSGHTQDDSFHLNGGRWFCHMDGSLRGVQDQHQYAQRAGRTVHQPSRSRRRCRSRQECGHRAAAERSAGMVDAAIAAARAQLANITFAYDEVTIPHGFDSTPGALGSHQTITVPANSSNDYPMKNDEWSVKSASTKSTAKPSSASRRRRV